MQFHAPSFLGRPSLALWAVILGLALTGPSRAEDVVNLKDLDLVELSKISVISASRAPTPPEEIPFSLTALTGDALRRSPSATLDGALRGVPGFSLFRRSDSFSANPTAQGVSLRGLGPSGAGRTLVLLDGVPLNDPFGGWVLWSKLPRESLTRVELLRGGGATAWGNAALGGVVQLVTETPADGRNRITTSVGSFATRNAELASSLNVGPGTLQLLAQDFSTDGFLLVAPEDRGPVDRAAGSKHHWASARWQQQLTADLRLTVTGRTFRDRRGNGTEFQRNSSRESFGSVLLEALAGRSYSWTAVAYAQDQRFASTFSSVNATRTAETPASDQFAVPATALGAAWTGVWETADDTRTSAGLDYRRVRGETREHFTFSAGNFTRLRVAGGTQEISGLFVLHERALAPDLRATLGGRLDGWRELDGRRRETERATGNVLRNETYADRDGLEFSPSVGVVWTAAPGWRVRVAGQRSFRRPTLNELYRPFRVGNVITEANAALETERATSAELGVDHTRGTLTLGAAFFWNDLRDAVGNVTLYRGPGSFPIVGFVPAGGLGRQRLNLDRIRVQGLELSAKWSPTPALSLSADYLYNDATVRSANVALTPGQPDALAGNRLAQVPRHTVALGAAWQPVTRLAVTSRVRALDRQFEDDENLLRLGAVLIADLGVSYKLTKACELYLNAENITDARIETGRSADGIVNTGTPRLVLGGVRCSW